ncbi:heparan-alpha-glucosaminide N-acetyltransferase domain-containing protein [Opitutus sp. ER46]|uniref:acyltransferase family protein n=1 Tax=Opitutus sp. ER46 TaxID=2161864 RepID=UPI000D3271B3|nr:heparan-alpha-glucosaminide N-acetyltransferase domain-containing protein [Opitutus sp. ER46]PTX90990.1 DUF5009 domain-containing protein [Opitutus sp. ER46]
MNPTGRLVSLDAFRGATVAAMLLVNNPGTWHDVYPPLRHASWHGWTPTDMVFPFFLWIVGVAMTLSFGRRLEQGASPAELYRHVIVRAAIIFALGLLLATFPFGLYPGHTVVLGKLRIMGVLQRIALCYAAAGAIVLTTRVRGQVAWVAGLLLAYAAALQFIPVPGYGAGVLEPQGNLAWWVDSHLLAGHTWSGAPVRGFDPEGLLSTIPAIATTLLGALAGTWLRSARPLNARLGGLLAGGGGLVVAGLLWHLWLPINKNLWTSSFVLFMAGSAAVGLTLCAWLIDVRGWRRWAAPAVIFGMNAIAMYVLAGLVARMLTLIRWTDVAGTRVVLKTWLYNHVFVPVAPPELASLLFALAFVGVHFLVAWAMWRRQWFIKI